MKASVGAYEAKTHWSGLLDEVAGGQSVAITKNGLLVALVIPPTMAKVYDVKKSVEEFRKYRKNITLGGLSIREMIEKGRM